MTERERIFALLPALPAGLKWEMVYKRAWASLAIRRKVWWGWRILYKTELNPMGMGMEKAVLSAAYDIMDARAIVAA